MWWSYQDGAQPGAERQTTSEWPVRSRNTALPPLSEIKTLFTRPVYFAKPDGTIPSSRSRGFVSLPRGHHHHHRCSWMLVLLSLHLPEPQTASASHIVEYCHRLLAKDREAMKVVLGEVVSGCPHVHGPSAAARAQSALSSSRLWCCGFIEGFNLDGSN